jgi:hypothetical protein
MAKLAGIVKPGGTYDIQLIGGATLVVGGNKPTMMVERADDDAQVLVIASAVPSGRHKGHKARLFVPYSAIVELWAPS